MMGFGWPLRVYYEDTDAGGVVYHANYLRFMERARTEWLRTLGYEQDALKQGEGLIFAVRSAQVEYLRPARFNEQLMVWSQVSRVGGASLTFAQQVQRDDEVLATGVVRVASVDAGTMRPRALEPGMLARFRELR